MGFFTKRERNELDRLRERTVHEFVPPHEESNTRQSVPPHQEVRTRREPTAQDLGPLLARASGNSLQQIDDLIDGLQSMRDRLSDEAARVQREMIAYARFSQLTVDSTKVVSESLRNSFPILGPSEEPTLIPSDEGSANPLEQPAVTPSEQPTLSLVEQSPLSPSEEAALSPSEEEAPNPSEEAILSPSEEATLSPSEEATSRSPEESTRSGQK